MQQHSQIIELKDRLVQALDEQLNVKDNNEVNRVISILEHSHVTREDLEKTRLGKYINELRKKTNDKELAKRAKKLIKSWREFAVTGAGNSVTNNALTSPFNSNSVISPHSLSNDSLAFGNSYAPVSTNGHSRISNSYDSKGTGNNNPTSNHHPALARIRNQHSSLTSPNENSKTTSNSLSPSLLSNISPKLGAGKLSVSFRPHSHSASPQNNELSNGFKSSSANNNHTANKRTTNHSNLTSPVNFISSNGLSPGLRNNFKNILSKDGVSPNAYRRRTTPPTPKSVNSPNAVTSSTNPDSAHSSRHCSPVAFTFSNESRDSTSYSNKNSYSNQDEFSTLDTNDEDSNSSIFSSLSTDGITLVNNSKTCDINSNSKRKNRKRKIESDTLRENLNSIINSGGRRLQSTHELVQKFNIKLKSNIHSKSDRPYNSLSASSSPGVLLGKDGLEIPLKRFKKRKNGIDSYQNGYYLDESSNDCDSAISRNKSLPSSPALLSDRGMHLSSSAISPSLLSRNSYMDDDEEYDDDDHYKTHEIDSRHHSKRENLSYFNSEHSLDFKSVSGNNVPTLTDIDREIMEIYAKLPKVSPEDVAYMEQFSLSDEPNDEDEIVSSDSKVDAKKEQPLDDGSGLQEFEEIEFDEEYEVEEEVETEVTDSEVSEDDLVDVNSNNDVALYSSNNSEASNHSDKGDSCQNCMSDINNCDNLDNPTASDVSQEHVEPADVKMDVDDCFQIDSQQPISSIDDMVVSSSCSVANLTDYPQADSVISDESVASHSNISNDDQVYIKETQSNDDVQSIEMLSYDSVDKPMNSLSEIEDDDTCPSNNIVQSFTETTHLNAESDTTTVQKKMKKKKKMKKILKRVLKKKYRKCRTRSNVKKCLVDRLENEQWEYVNGTYDKDGVWHDFGEMTSAFVLSNSDNANCAQDDNVLHILPYVNYTW